MSEEPAKNDAIIKLFVTEDERDLIRVAAALRRSSMGDYCYQVVLADAQNIAGGIAIPPAVPSVDPKPKISW